MRLRDAVRRAVGYHLRALPPTLAGLGIAGAGVWYGVDPGTSATALAASGRLAPTVGLVLVGTAVTAVGRTAVRLDATAAAVSDRVAADLDEDDLRETVAIATDRAVAASFDGAAAEIEARVVDAVDRTVSETGPAPDARAGSACGDSAPRTDAPDAFAASRPSETNALADATRRASERVESYLADGDAEEFRGLAEGAVVLDDEAGGRDGVDGADSAVPAAFDGAASEDTTAADAANAASATEASAAAETAEGSELPGDVEGAARSDGAEILDGDRSAAGQPDGSDGDDAVIIDGDDAAADGNEMVFGGDVRDPESDAA